MCCESFCYDTDTFVSKRLTAQTVRQNWKHAWVAATAILYPRCTAFDCPETLWCKQYEPTFETGDQRARGNSTAKPGNHSALICQHLHTRHFVNADGTEAPIPTSLWCGRRAASRGRHETWCETSTRTRRKREKGVSQPHLKSYRGTTTSNIFSWSL